MESKKIELTIKESEILANLLESGIDNYKSVLSRTGKECWVERVNELELIKKKLVKIIEN